MKLQSRLFLYLRFKNTMFPENWDNIPAEPAYSKSIDPGLAAFRAREARR